MKLKKYDIYFTIVDIIFVFLIFLFVMIKKPVEVELLGPMEDTLEVGTEYQDSLYRVHIGSKEIELKDTSYEIKTDLDINTLGSYTYTYEIQYRHKHFTLERTIQVVDTTAPVIEIDDNVLKKNVCKNGTTSNEATAIDNYDGDITDKITKELLSNGINYKVVDSSNNIAEVFKEVSFKDKEKPKLTINGTSTMYIVVGEKYNEPGYTATDNCDGDLTSKVVVTSDLDENKKGTYTIKYEVSDAKGNSRSTTRTVIVCSEKEKEESNIKQEIENYITKNKYNASVIYYDINSGYQYSYKPTNTYFGASLIKTAAALYAYENMTLTDEIRSLVEPTISVSNNSTYIKLANKIGIEKLKKYAISIGLACAKNLSSERYYVNTTANEQLALWKYLWNFIKTNKNGKELQNYFINDTARYLDFDGLPEVMHKYGLANGYFNDVGIVLDDHPYIIVVLTKEGNANYGKIVSEISKKVYELHKIVNKK